MAQARPNEIPSYIKAKSPLGLRRLMVRNQVKHHGLTIQYFDIQNVDGIWYAWYYISLQDDDELFQGDE